MTKIEMPIIASTPTTAETVVARISLVVGPSLLDETAGDTGV